jgi:predicted RNase H-like HicB family nuclease
MLHIEIDRETDGRFIAEVVELPGVLAYGTTAESAVNQVAGLALQVLADRAAHGEPFFSSEFGDPLPLKSIFEIKFLQ